MSSMNSAFSTSCTVDSPRPFREWFPLNSKDHPPNGWEKIVEVDVMLSPVCVRVSRSARESLFFRGSGSCPMSLAVPRLVSSPRWSAGKTPSFSLSIGIGNFRSQGDTWGREALLMTWPWLIVLRIRPGKWKFGSCRSQASINSGYKSDPARRLKVYSTPMRLKAQGCWALINPSTWQIAEPDPRTYPIDTFPNKYILYFMLILAQWMPDCYAILLKKSFRTKTQSFFLIEGRIKKYYISVLSKESDDLLTNCSFIASDLMLAASCLFLFYM